MIVLNVSLEFCPLQTSEACEQESLNLYVAFLTVHYVVLETYIDSHSTRKLLWYMEVRLPPPTVYIHTSVVLLVGCQSTTTVKVEHAILGCIFLFLLQPHECAFSTP